MIPCSSVWYKKSITNRKSCICQVEFPIWDLQIQQARSFIHLSIRTAALPPAEHVQKLVVKRATSQAVLREPPLSVSSCMSFSGRRAAIDVCTVHCTKHAIKEWEEFEVLLNKLVDRVISIRQTDKLRIKCWRCNRNEDAAKVSEIAT